MNRHPKCGPIVFENHEKKSHFINFANFAIKIKYFNFELGECMECEKVWSMGVYKVRYIFDN